jgi:hypothetical protein
VSAYLSACVVWTEASRVEGMTIATALHNCGVKLFEWEGDENEAQLRWLKEAVDTCDRLIVVCARSSIEQIHVQFAVDLMHEREGEAGGEAWIIPVLLHPEALGDRSISTTEGGAWEPTEESEYARDLLQEQIGVRYSTDVHLNAVLKILAALKKNG